MSYKDVLLLLRAFPAPPSKAVVEDAVTVAASLGAKISGLSAITLPAVPRSLFGNAILDIAGLVAEQKRKVELDLLQVRTLFQKQASAQGVFGRDILEECTSEAFPAVLSAHTRVHDLTIIPMPDGGYLSHFDSHWFAEAVMFESGRPTIVLPETRKHDRTFALGTVLIAWDRSRAAARAIADARPLLKSAASTLIVTVTGEKTLAQGSPPAELIENLACHGIQASHQEIFAGGRRIGTVLNDLVAAHQVDLLVMGSYGRPRFHEFVLGGATNSMLSHPPTALFLSH